MQPSEGAATQGSSESIAERPSISVVDWLVLGLQALLVRRVLQRRSSTHRLAQLPPSAVVARSQHVTLLRAAADLAALRARSFFHSQPFGGDFCPHGAGNLSAGKVVV